MSFTFRPAIKEKTPLLIGLVGPTWTGKTYSALRLATGIVKARGGKIIGIDTEARRMLQYADVFKFEYLEFGEPFSSLRYAEALRAAAIEAQGGCVIVDSMSHEHEGLGGYLDFHGQEVNRLITSGGFKSEGAAEWPAYKEPAKDRRVLINAVLQLQCSFIFCFRAKEKMKKVGGKLIEVGWQAIAGEEFGFEMTLRCLLTPGCKGVPDWSDEAMKLGVPKCIQEHEPLVPVGAQLSEEIGYALALSASGKKNANGTAPVTSGPAPDPQGPLVGTVEAVSKGKNGVKDGQPWQAYHATISGIEYVTLDVTTYDMVCDAFRDGLQVEITWTPAKNNQRKIESIVIVGAPAESEEIFSEK